MSTVKIWQQDTIIPTYKVYPPEKNPLFIEKRAYQGSTGKVYPLPVTEKISDTKEDVSYHAVYLENEYLKLMILPELGGRIQRALDKTNNYDFVYYNHVIKPALVGLAGPWISGGIEFNWPQHHRPSTYAPVDYLLKENPDGSCTVHLSEIDKNQLFSTLYNKALEGDKDCGGLLAYGYLSGEHITHFEEGRPLFVRTPGSHFSLANFMRVNLYTALGALKTGLDILSSKEGVEVDKILGHGGLFKTPGVGQKILAAAMNAPVSVMETAGEGGAWGIALLASYMLQKKDGESLEDYLDSRVFADSKAIRVEPDTEDVAGFETFMKRYQAGLAIERAAVESLAD